MNDSIAKPSVNVAVGDEIEITFGQTILTVKVTMLKEHVKKDEAAMLYEVVKEERTNS